jgi:hypothetical protein
MDAGTRILQVVHRNGARATAKPQRPAATLFQVVEGPHLGRRDAADNLRDLVGPLDWDREWLVIYETGEHVRTDEFAARPRANWGEQ